MACFQACLIPESRNSLSYVPSQPDYKPSFYRLRKLRLTPVESRIGLEVNTKEPFCHLGPSAPRAQVSQSSTLPPVGLSNSLPNNSRGPIQATLVSAPRTGCSGPKMFCLILISQASLPFFKRLFQCPLLGQLLEGRLIMGWGLMLASAPSWFGFITSLL